MLSQLRAGFSARPKNFPAAVILCGLRDVRDYKAASGGDPTRLASSSPFNVKVKSILLANFSREQVEELYYQYTEETGQAFGPEAISKAFDVTRGQPWLVNALAREIVEEIKDPLEKGLRQLDEYLGKVALETGVLVLFDRRSGAEDIETRTRFEEVFTPSGKKVTLLRG